MNKRKKNIFRIPTWLLFTLGALCLIFTVHDLYIILNLESLSTISIGGVKIGPGSPEYSLVMAETKKSYVVQAIDTTLLSFLFGWFAFRRRKINIEPTGDIGNRIF